ncbi:MAG TPA: rhomboid family intramembrane serine protease [Candidatus Hydrogenedentes bacterium]|nr:rhomboid family intramembrane serine protease [Candidatus Hydrogenedentota bacterium]HIJ74692.1 rhomboid family intramembrane serine protease [Candidatus Hydrogenedentota bacterium]
MTYDYYGQGQSRLRFFAERITWGTRRLILANLIVFVGQLIVDVPWGRMPGMAPGGAFVYDWLMFAPGRFLHHFHGFIWQPFTYMFLHASLWHLFRNMLWLFIFGPMVERRLGTRQFLRFYILCGALGVLATYLRLKTPAAPVLGASGAVMGVLMAAAIADPDRQIFLFPFPIPINMRALIFIVVAFDIVSALGGGHTSVATHIGGLAVALCYMKLAPPIRRWVRTLKREHEPPNSNKDPIGEAVDKIFDFEEERRRRQR